MEKDMKDTNKKNALSTIEKGLYAPYMYSYASIEYFGLASYSYIKVGGELLAHSAVIITTPIWNTTVKSSKYIVNTISTATKASLKATVNSYKWLTNGVGAGYKKTVNLCTTKRTKQLNRIEEMIFNIDRRLAEMEKYGIVMQTNQTPVQKDEKKKVNEEKKAFLKGIVQQNIMLRV
ncbi:MAG: hypothetical protein HQK87_11630 [Nitrospinae bacterium]|nr:hypothetical protein [Nitrospinota bacterium]